MIKQQFLLTQMSTALTFLHCQAQKYRRRHISEVSAPKNYTLVFNNVAVRQNISD